MVDWLVGWLATGWLVGWLVGFTKTRKTKRIHPPACSRPPAVAAGPDARPGKAPVPSAHGFMGRIGTWAVLISAAKSLTFSGLNGTPHYTLQS